MVPVVVGIVALALGVAVGFVIRRAVARSQTESAEGRAQKVILEAEREAEPAAREPGRVMDGDAGLPEARADVARRLQHLGGGAGVDHHLEQRHHRHRVEEVHPEEALGTGEPRGETGDAEG